MQFDTRQRNNDAYGLPVHQRKRRRSSRGKYQQSFPPSRILFSLNIISISNFLLTDPKIKPYSFLSINVLNRLEIQMDKALLTLHFICTLLSL